MNQPIRFSGEHFANQLEIKLAEKVARLTLSPKIMAIFFEEDEGSQLYTKLKTEAAIRVGIIYQAQGFSLADPLSAVVAQIKVWADDPSVTGIIVQKPWAKTWVTAQIKQGILIEESEIRQRYAEWWDQLMSAIPLVKDVDGLSLATRQALQTGAPVKVVPATCRAVLFILAEAIKLGAIKGPMVKIALLGKSDLLTIPLHHRLSNYTDWQIDQLSEKTGTIPASDVQIQWQSQIFTSVSLAKYLTDQKDLSNFQVIVSATGVPDLVQSDWIAPGAVLIDAGEPKADISTVAQSQASFFTPVPGGVGPLTVVFLLMNCLDLSDKK